MLLKMIEHQGYRLSIVAKVVEHIVVYCVTTNYHETEFTDYIEASIFFDDLIESIPDGETIWH